MRLGKGAVSYEFLVQRQQELYDAILREEMGFPQAQSARQTVKRARRDVLEASDPRPSFRLRPGGFARRRSVASAMSARNFRRSMTYKP